MGHILLVKGVMILEVLEGKHLYAIKENNLTSLGNVTFTDLKSYWMKIIGFLNKISPYYAFFSVSVL